MFTDNIPADYLHDESRRTGSAAGIAFPRSTEDVRNALRSAQARGGTVTVQGARTGISGGAVPDADLIISLARMTRISAPVALNADGRYTVTLQPGVLLSELREFLNRARPDGAGRLIFPPDPTETGASLGGMAACNASGACSFAYGATRQHISAVQVVLADGDTLTLQRGMNFAAGRRFSLTTDQGRRICGALPQYTTPALKSAAGYWIRADMDLIDLFIGSEGTLGVITEIELLLTPAPDLILGIFCFFNEEQQALRFTEALRASAPQTTARLSAIEYFDEAALQHIRSAAPQSGLRLPRSKAGWKNAIYIEWAQRGPAAVDHLTLTSALMQQCGATADDTWLAPDAPGLKLMKALRHALPERINSIIAERKRSCPELTKLGTDLSVPDSRLHAVMELYRSDLARESLEHVIFGHIGDNHLHVNILPRDMEEYARGRALYTKWAQQVAAWGGSVSAEHGIGRLKKELLTVMYGEDHIQEMRQLKALFDPEFILNPGRLFERRARGA